MQLVGRGLDIEQLRPFFGSVCLFFPMKVARVMLMETWVYSWPIVTALL